MHNCVFVRERDLDNYYWKIDKKEALQALQFAKSKVMEALGLRTYLWYSIAKGNHRQYVGSEKVHIPCYML